MIDKNESSIKVRTQRSYTVVELAQMRYQHADLACYGTMRDVSFSDLISANVDPEDVNREYHELHRNMQWVRAEREVRQRLCSHKNALVSRHVWVHEDGTPEWGGYTHNSWHCPDCGVEDRRRKERRDQRKKKWWKR